MGRHKSEPEEIEMEIKFVPAEMSAAQEEEALRGLKRYFYRKYLAEVLGKKQPCTPLPQVDGEFPASTDPDHVSNSSIRVRLNMKKVRPALVALDEPPEVMARQCGINRATAQNLKSADIVRVQAKAAWKLAIRLRLPFEEVCNTNYINGQVTW